ncbi:hypothetical protein K491DRAFT_712367 [Lophiostoma macrostomum CBS 122681]|uniref:Uncharacterized protein n=1 Tax=Lophiostoma macrostomum CBS 122681 TaxID=1314788 RepID=A0A6A6TJB9_9PLEO|nr:hypothetical protein K491DRAFT_712367 [Lophiostoma macrostomum CBS 122681]
MPNRSHLPDKVFLRLSRPGKSYDEIFKTPGKPDGTHKVLLETEKLKSSIALCAKVKPGGNIRVADSKFCEKSIENLVTTLTEKRKHLDGYLGKVKPSTLGEWGIVGSASGSPARTDIKDLVILFATQYDADRIMSTKELYPSDLIRALEKNYHEEEAGLEGPNKVAQTTDKKGETAQNNASDQETAGTDRRSRPRSGNNDTNSNNIAGIVSGPLPANADMTLIVEAFNRTVQKEAKKHQSSSGVRATYSDVPLATEIASSISIPPIPQRRPASENAAPREQHPSGKTNQTPIVEKGGTPQKRLAEKDPQQLAMPALEPSKATMHADQVLNKQLPRNAQSVEGYVSNRSESTLQAERATNKQVDKNSHPVEQPEIETTQASAGFSERPSLPTNSTNEKEPDEQPQVETSQTRTRAAGTPSPRTNSTNENEPEEEHAGVEDQENAMDIPDTGTRDELDEKQADVKDQEIASNTADSAKERASVHQEVPSRDKSNQEEDVQSGLEQHLSRYEDRKEDESEPACQ